MRLGLDPEFGCARTEGPSTSAQACARRPSGGGLFGYTLSRAGARSLLAAVEREGGMRRGVDWFVINHFEAQGLSSYYLSPELLHTPLHSEEKPVDSDIQGDFMFFLSAEAARRRMARQRVAQLRAAGPHGFSIKGPGGRRVAALQKAMPMVGGLGATNARRMLCALLGEAHVEPGVCSSSSGASTAKDDDKEAGAGMPGSTGERNRWLLELDRALGRAGFDARRHPLPPSKSGSSGMRSIEAVEEVLRETRTQVFLV